MCCVARDVLQSSIDSSGEIIAFEEDNDMEEPQNSKSILPTSPKKNNGLHLVAMRSICPLVRNDINVIFVVV